MSEDVCRIVYDEKSVLDCEAFFDVIDYVHGFVRHVHLFGVYC